MSSKRTLNLIIILVFLLSLLPGGQPTHAATVSVTTTFDVNDGDTSSIDNLIAVPGPDGEISLREAIIAANNTSGPDTIGFELPDDDWHYDGLSGVWTITPNQALPPLSGGGTSINGYTQEGASEATADSPASLVVEISGLTVLANNGINITSAENVIRGLVINNFPMNGIAIGATTAISNTIAGNYIGTTPDGLSDDGNTFAGVYISFGAQNNLVGGDTPADRNIISGNEFDGVNIHGENTAGNVISGNYIGTDESGTARIGNTLDGVHIYGSAHDNLVGGTNPASGNLISGNHRDGVRITGQNTMTNTISANYIGLNVAGTSVMSNYYAGVTIHDGAQHNIIGGDTQGERNVIVGSSGAMCSLCIYGHNTNNNVVMGNYIGTDESGTVGLRYDVDIDGIRISDGAKNNTIGPGNLISGHSYYGVYFSGIETTHNTVIWNYIGTNADGDSAVGNQLGGIYINNAHYNTIGGIAAGDGNLISGNDGYGIQVTTSHDVSILGNYIGSTADGMDALPNGESGIRVEAAIGTVIGGVTTEERNIISGNESSGIIIADSADSIVSGNYIGISVNGSDALGNGEYGVYIIDNSVVVTIGPGNTIAYNDQDGIHINGNLTTNNTITQNSIFQNTDLGIELSDGGNYNLAAPNITAGSCEGLVSGTACAGCTVEIFSDGLNEGRYYEGTTTADETTGAFSWSGSINGPNLTATATDPDDNTSSFSTPFDVGVCNTAPTAYFSLDPLSGPLSTAFRFDASGSTDTEDDTADLEVRWDWTDDGTYDTDWDISKTIMHTYSMTYTYTIRLEVRDTGGLTDNTIRQVIVVDDYTVWQVYLPYVER